MLFPPKQSKDRTPVTATMYKFEVAPHRLIPYMLTPFLLALAVGTSGFVLPYGRWQCVAWQDTGMCNLYCNCSDQTATCCYTWKIGTECKSCVWFFYERGPSQCRWDDGRTYIQTEVMKSDCIDDWGIGSSGEPTANGECACAGGTFWEPAMKPCDPSCP